MNFFEIFTVIKENVNFRYLLIAFGLKQGTMNGFGLLLSDIFTPYGYSAGYISFIGVCLFVSGIAGVITCSIIADKTLKLKAIMLGLSLTVSISLTVLAIYVADVFSFRLILAMIGATFCGLPFLP